MQEVKCLPRRARLNRASTGPRWAALFTLLATAATATSACSSGGGGGTYSTPDAGGAPGNENGNGDGVGSGSDAGPAADGGPTGLAYPLTLTPLTKAITQTANISLFFSVADANNHGVPNLKPSAFTYLEDNAVVDPTESSFTVTPLTGNQLTIPTVLVLQTSPSIIANGELDTLKKAAKTIIANMLPEQTIEVMTFADQVTPNVRVGFTNDKTKLNAAIDGITTADGTSTNLYGTLINALGQWTDGFSSMNATSGQLTAGLCVVITNGRDNAARATLQAVTQAQGNKRIVAVGIGTTTGATPTLDVNALKNLDPHPIIAPTYADLVADIGQVTDAIHSRGTSIYAASYCSPKRSGPMNDHKLSFTIVGNSAYNATTCHSATFSAQQQSACTALNNDFTQACYQTGNQEACCPANKPYTCATNNLCYATAQEAAADCGSACTLCGGTGQGDAQDNQLVPGTQIVVPFNSTSYASGQCPALWQAECKSMQDCCKSIGPGTYNQQCTSVLNSYAGNETSCQTGLAQYCPTGTNCAALKTCCGTFTGGGQSQCYSYLQATGNNEATCQTYDAYTCPTGANCTHLKTCCEGLADPQRSSCEQQLIVAQGNENTCTSYLTSFMCP